MRQCSTASCLKIYKKNSERFWQTALQRGFKYYIQDNVYSGYKMHYDIYILWYGLLKFKYCDNGKSFGIKGTEGLLFQYYLGLSKLTGLRSGNQSHNQDEYNYLYCTTIALF